MKLNKKIISSGIILLLICLFFVGCIQQTLPNTHHDESENYGTELQVVELNLEECINTFAFQEQQQKEFVINSNDEYRILLQYNSSRPSCTNFTLPEINFSQYTLLGKFVSASGCSIEFHKSVYRNDTNTTITYVIDVVTEGLCDMLGASMNWVLVPKIPSNYTVHFKVN